MTLNVLSMKWGTRYTSGYVNRLYASVASSLDQPFRFLCFTDDPSGLLPEIESCEMPDLEFPERAFVRGAWPKIGVLKSGLANMQGQCLFLDLDIVIRKPIAELLTYQQGRNCFIKDWEQSYQRLRHAGKPRIANTSVFRFEANSLGYIYDEFAKSREAALANYRNEQRFVSERLDGHCWWPSDWIVSFKRHCIPLFPANLLREPTEPHGAHIVVFHGRPNPHEALAGHTTGRVHRRVRPTTWIAKYWKPEPFQPARASA